MKIRFHPEADAELHEALSWYAQQKLGLDEELMHCIDKNNLLDSTQSANVSNCTKKHTQSHD